MKHFANYHPWVCMLYFISVAGIAMFQTHPVLLVLALLGGMCFRSLLEGGKSALRSLGFYVPLFCMVALVNPIFSHNGVTPLFFLNGNPVTAEAFLYGLDLAVLLVAVLYWCACYSLIMTGDKFLYLFGSVVPKLSLIFSMALRFLPLLKRRIKQVQKAQKVMGLYTGDSYVDKLKGGIRVLGAVIGWSLENAVETGDAMRARGYGLKGRSHYALFRFHAHDGSFLTVNLLLLAGVASGLLAGLGYFAFYPRVTPISHTVPAVAFYACYGVLAFFPCILEIKENLTWNYYRSKI